MKNRLLVVLTIFLIPVFVYAHSLVLNLDNNEDGTITVEGVFNTGQSAAGALIRLESLVSGEVLYKKRLPEESELIIKIPNEPYQIVLDGGPGHIVVKEGIAPSKGFTKEVKKQEVVQVSQDSSMTKKNTNFSNYIYIVTIVLLLLTLFISIKNTSKLMRQLEK